MSTLARVPFRVLLDGATAGVRRHFRRLFPAIALPLAAGSVVVVLMQMSVLRGMAGAETPDLKTVFGLVGPLFAAAIVFWVIYVLAFNATVVSAMDAVAGRPIQLRRAWLFSLRPPVLGTLFLMGLAGAVSLMLCLVPALYVLPVLGFVLPVMVDEGRASFEAIRRGVDLAHHNPSGEFLHYPWLQVLAVLVLGTVFSYALAMLVQLPFAIVQQVLLFREAASDSAAMPISGLYVALQIPASVLGSGAYTIAWMFQAFALCILFQEVRRRKEGGDIQAAIDELTGGPAATEAEPS